MTLTVREALQLDIFKTCRLRTGEAGLDNEIKWVNILEILDDLRHIEAGEFLITTAYDLNLQHDGRQRRIIKQFAGRKLAALAIQTGHYVLEIPPSFTALAEEHCIPVIEVPPEISFKSITRALLGALMRREETRKSAAAAPDDEALREAIRQRRALLEQLLAGTDPGEMKEELRHLGLTPAGNYFLLLIGERRGVERNGTKEQRAEGGAEAAALLEQALARLLLQLNLPFLLGPVQGKAAVLIQPGRPGQPDQPDREASLATARRLLGELNLLLPGPVFPCGTSSSYDHLSGIKSALGEAARALQALELGLAGGNGPLCYADLGIYRLLFEVANSESLKAICKETIAPLAAYDRQANGALIDTLRVYLKHVSISKSARELFIHRHTLKYRLNQIESLTGLSLEEPQNPYLFYLGLQIFYYLQARGIPIEP